MLELIDGREQSTPVHIPRPRAITAVDPSEIVSGIVDDVRMRGDDALIELTAKFDGPRLTPEEIRVPEDVISRARSLVRPELIDALEVMAERLRRTCEQQMPEEWFDRSTGDEVIGELIRPLRRVGVYVPGGRASYPSTVIMASIPAQVAGVGQVAVASPPDGRGEVSEAVLAACSVAGVSEVYRVGGAQAIAALAYGTTTVRPVDKIVGPGNIYVTLAKRQVRGWVGTDSEAGPTEIAIIADDTASADVLAADIVAQAEHGPLGTHALITWQPEVAERVMALLEIEVARHERPEELENTLIEGGRAVLVRDQKHAFETSNLFAPEHLQLNFEGAWDSLELVRNAGSVFVGPFTPVPVGDYVGGTNHVLPSGGSARFESGLGVNDFLKRIYVSMLDESALERMSPHVEALAEAEGLFGHARAVSRRLER
jgi:histidinol dehydrogenase